jgi:hypothetical protein
VKTPAWVFAAVVAGCASQPARFDLKDPKYTPSPGDAPRVFLRSTSEALPDVPMRSVGIITVPTTSDARAMQMAADRGRELGCWIVVEHQRFSRRQADAGEVDDARVLLACSGPHVRVLGGPSVREFDCVVRGADVPIALTGSVPAQSRS